MPGNSPRPWAQTNQFGMTTTRLATANAMNTLRQPNVAPSQPPIGAPTASDTSTPDTTNAVQLARCSRGAASATSVYTEGETAAAAVPATNRTANSQASAPTTAV